MNFFKVGQKLILNLYVSIYEAAQAQIVLYGSTTAKKTGIRIAQ